MLRQSVRPPTTDQRGRDKHCRAEWASGWGSQLHGGGEPAPTQKPLLTPPCWRGLSLSRAPCGHSSSSSHPPTTAADEEPSRLQPARPAARLRHALIRSDQSTGQRQQT
jgi:hypothetical protein